MNSKTLFTYSERITLSVVVPIFNESKVLPTLYQRLQRILAPLDITYQLVLVDDGSRDDSIGYLYTLASQCPRVKVVRLSRNFGKEAALSAGLAQADGDAVIIIDADLQDPPELIPSMLDAWRAGAEVVAMKRRRRAGESWFKRYSARCFYRLLQRLSPVAIPTDTGDFRLMSRAVVNAINTLPERNRYMKGLFAWVGFNTQVIEYDRHPRVAGCSKWRYRSLLRLAIEGITSFSVAPLQWAMLFGIGAAAGGLMYGIWIVLKAVVLGDPVAGYPSLVAMITFLGGVQLLFTGIVGEYVGKIYNETKQRPLYIISEVLVDNQVQRDHQAQVNYAALR